MTSPQPPEPRSDEDEAPMLPSRSDDDSDVGWGDEPTQRDEDWYRRERPPHHE